MNYVFDIAKQARNYIDNQPAKVRERLLGHIYRLPAGDVKPLHGMRDCFRLRVGSFRVVFHMERVSMNEVQIRIIEVGTRGDIYKDD